MFILKKRAPFGVVVWGLLKTFFLTIPKFVWNGCLSRTMFDNGRSNNPAKNQSLLHPPTHPACHPQDRTGFALAIARTSASLSAAGSVRAFAILFKELNFIFSAPSFKKELNSSCSVSSTACNRKRKPSWPHPSSPSQPAGIIHLDIIYYWKKTCTWWNLIFLRLSKRKTKKIFRLFCFCKILFLGKVLSLVLPSIFKTPRKIN